VPIATNVVSLNSAHGKVYSMQNYVIKFVTDIPVGGVLQVLLFPTLMKPNVSMTNYSRGKRLKIVKG
jgi:hypothetical protein